jgi:ABC-type polar amino acid transport system ATPase subunit
MEGVAGAARTALSIRGLRLSRGSTPVLRGVDLTVPDGEMVALMGLSGGGKTTILRAVVGLEPFDAGAIDVGGVSLAPGAAAAGALRALRSRVGMVFQYHGLFEHLTALENVALAPVHVSKTRREDAEAKALELFAALGVEHVARSLPRELSGGQAQRVAIARALAMDPPLLLMDEPTASLDPARRRELGLSLARLVAGGRTLVVATHDDDFVLEFASRVVILADGAVVEEGAPGTVLKNPSHPATRLLLQTKSAQVLPFLG